MSPLDPELPPAGEEVHIPGNSFVPVAMAAGITLLIVGTTTTFAFVIAGAIITIVSLYRWLRDARHELDELPPGH